jgi:sporulation protein YlmC with PRC-barrel domain
MALSFSCDEEKKVITKDGRQLGLLSGAVLDTKTWTVIYLQVRVTKELLAELGRKKHFGKPGTISIATSTVSVVGDVVQLNVDMKELPDHLHA